MRSRRALLLLPNLLVGGGLGVAHLTGVGAEGALVTPGVSAGGVYELAAAPGTEGQAASGTTTV